MHKTTKYLADKKENWDVICSELKQQGFVITEEPIIDEEEIETEDIENVSEEIIEEVEEEKEEAIEKQLFNLAGAEVALGKSIKYLVYYTYKEFADKLQDNCLIIDYKKFSSFSDWENSRDCSNDIPVRYGKAQKKRGQVPNKL